MILCDNDVVIIMSKVINEQEEESEVLLWEIDKLESLVGSV